VVLLCRQVKPCAGRKKEEKKEEKEKVAKLPVLGLITKKKKEGRFVVLPLCEMVCAPWTPKRKRKEKKKREKKRGSDVEVQKQRGGDVSEGVRISHDQKERKRKKKDWGQTHY